MPMRARNSLCESVQRSCVNFIIMSVFVAFSQDDDKKIIYSCHGYLNDDIDSVGIIFYDPQKEIWLDHKPEGTEDWPVQYLQE